MKSVKEKAVSSSPSMQLRPGDLRLHATSKPKLVHVVPLEAFTKLRGIQADMQIPMKTFGPDQGEIHWNDGSGRIADLINVTVTIIRLTNPNTGLVSIEMSLEYLISSDGARTPDGRPFPGATHDFDPGREDYNLYHNVYFRNSSGGLVYHWALDKDFALVCGWNRQHRFHQNIETNQLDWFDLVSQYQWEVGGAFYRC
jgi:hypothetical protein